ncbi:lipid-A-disaccharide synthase N-terminal domain-containing protein [Limimaricola sp.]|uniref:lipid-A-disaccharide synthase N-terminal domain-containing protein n=1 Tax=Limimaricola sp. TaxID=2211665 RepID=UPI0040595CFC
MLSDWFAEHGWIEVIWLTIGFLAQAMFSARFLVQWIASEKVRKSIVPEAFWYFSAGGGAMLLAYAIYRQDPVFILGQAFGLMVYARNIYFIWSERHTGEPGHEG